MSERTTVFGEHDPRTVVQLQTCLDAGGSRAVLCADGHLGYAQPVGGVVAYEDTVSVSGVGFDIACGNMAVKLPMPASALDGKCCEIARTIAAQVSFGLGRRNDTRVEAACLEDDPAWAIPKVSKLRELACAQLGTVGSGNHYVDVFADDDGFVWIGVHFGSRGLGHKIATHFLKAAGGKDGMMVPPAVLPAASDLGEQYLLAMHLAGRYAYAGREWVCRTVTEIVLGRIEWLDHVHNHHNFAWRETHDARDYWVVRKGATPAFPSQRGFVGGSMGDVSVILRGVDGEAARTALYSTVHGAGRVMGRREAAGRWKYKKGRPVSLIEPGKVDEARMRREVAARGTVLLGGGTDEAPEVYRRLDDVLEQHKGTVAVETRLRPLIVVMAAAGEFDPYKD